MAAQCPLTTEPMDCYVGRRSSFFAQPACSAIPAKGEGPQMCTLMVNGTFVSGLLDSGSLVTLISATLPHIMAPGKTLGVTCIHA
ncbi:hypothetical protein GDO81_024573 [Engystomops pustulosus]|uniref:Peptidase A2 domain-containing protein n=1 Tax=Engystomops pustulosus TaxID=76066 RepID=A0AAV6YRB7_ENGPU|nr:hypothetical protein GDO81_024573 [Engystomops pustulosus]